MELISKIGVCARETRKRILKLLRSAPDRTPCEIALG